MKKSEIIDKLHSLIIIYLLFGWVIESQRSNLVLLLPTFQFQFLMNNNECFLTDLENQYLSEEKSDKQIESFVDEKLKKININIRPFIMEYIIHGSVYMSFLMNYCLM